MRPMASDGRRLLNQLGFEQADLLASGMEGDVYRIGDGRIAKIWNAQPVPKLQRLQSFYDSLTQSSLGFGTPQIEQVLTHGAHLVSVEREWPGRTLQDWLSPDDAAVPDEQVEPFVRILSALKGVPATPAMYHLPVLDETRVFWAGASSFQEALLMLLERQVHRFGHFWHAEIKQFTGRYQALRQHLQALDHVPDTALHGDLFGGNVLLLPGGQLSAVLDFGVFAGAGDPRFDAAICGAVVNMYGLHASTIMHDMTRDLASALGYDLPVLRLYQAAYALATSNLYSPDGSDGHFRWCIQQWRKPELLEAL